jgi:hypothetical protein
MSRAMKLQAAHNKDYFCTLLSKHQLSKEESVSYRVSKKQKTRRLMSSTWDWRLVFSGMFGIPLESRVCFRKSEPLLKKQSYAMRMKTHVFNYTSNWLQRAGVHWQECRRTKQYEDSWHCFKFSPVQSLSRTGFTSVQKYQVCLSFFFNWRLWEETRRNSQLIQHRLSVLISTSLTAQPFLKTWNLLIWPDIPNSYGTQRLINMFAKYRLLTLSRESGILSTAPCLISLRSILH